MVRSLILAWLLVFSSLAGDEGQPPPDKALHALFEREFQLTLEEHPKFATFVGVPGYDDRLTDLSPAAVMRRRAHLKNKIKELRSRSRTALGERFDIRRFHNALLDDGPLPLTMLEARIDDWIALRRR